MASLPPEPVALKGGCLCAAIRYTISIPPIELRPQAPNAAPTSIKGELKTTVFPLIELDHCSSCRLAAGSIVQAWIVCPKSWVTWSLIPKTTHSTHGKTAPKPKKEDYQAYTTDDITQASEEPYNSTYFTEFISSPDVHRGFCGRCGTTLTYCYTGPKPGWPLPERNFDVALGTLDREYLELEGVRPDRHGWWSDGVGWVKKLVREGDVERLVRHPTGSTAVVTEASED